MIMLKDALARLRRERGLTQEELAHEAGGEPVGMRGNRARH